MEGGAFMPRFSVIVPVYKVERYLERCVESVLGQTFADYELILVDDGSPDRCGELCDRYAAIDDRVIVIHQENSGVSAARNRGVAAASGEYVAFVDADDLISLDFLQCANECLRDYPDADIVQFGWRSFDDGEPIAQVVNKAAKVKIHDRNSAMRDFLRFTTFTHAPWGKLIRRGLLEGIEFPLGIKVGEDLFVSYKLLGKASKIVSTDAVAYYYCIRPGSAMTSRGPSAVEDAMWVFGQMNGYYHECFPHLSNEADLRYTNDMLQLLRDLRSMKDTSEKRVVESEIRNALVAVPNAVLNRKTAIFKELALRCPVLYFLLYKVKK